MCYYVRVDINDGKYNYSPSEPCHNKWQGSLLFKAMAREFSKSFYNSKVWKQTRENVLRRDYYMCVMCGHPAEEVHHKIHLTPENINNPAISLHESNLISLCGDCHKRLHAGEQSNNQSDVLPLIGFDDEGNPIEV